MAGARSLRPLARLVKGAGWCAQRSVETSLGGASRTYTVAATKKCQAIASIRPRSGQPTVWRRGSDSGFATTIRTFSASTTVAHGHLDPPKPGEEYVSERPSEKERLANGVRLHVTFVDKDNDEHTFVVSKGDNLLDIAQANDVEMEGKDSSL